MVQDISLANSMLLHLMEAQDITKQNLVQVFGCLEVVNKVINRNLQITPQQALELGKLFHVDASLFQRFISPQPPLQRGALSKFYNN